MRRATRQIFVGDVAIGGDAPIAVQSMTFTKTKDVKGTVAQIKELESVGCDIVRVAVTDKYDVAGLKDIKSQINIPIISDIHFNYKLALSASEVVDAVRINPGNIGSKDRIIEVVNACNARSIPIRIGVNGGSLEKEFDIKYGNTPKGMVESALYNIKLLEDCGFTNMKISLKSSDVVKTVTAYKMLAPLVDYPFHIGVTEAGTRFSSTIKSSIGLGALLLEGIGDTMRVSITGEIKEEVLVARGILRSLGLLNEGINFISCPTCGRLEADLVRVVDAVTTRLAHIKTPLNISILGCAVNAIGEAKHSDLGIAFGNGKGLIIQGEDILANLKEDELIDDFTKRVENIAESRGEKIKR